MQAPPPFVLSRIRRAVGMLTDVSQLLGSKVPPSNTIPGVEARGITYVTFSGLVVPNITHYQSSHLGNLKLLTSRVNCYAFVDVWRIY